MDKQGGSDTGTTSENLLHEAEWMLMGWQVREGSFMEEAEF